jgi:ATP-dependent RNA helicase RhlE
MGFIRDIRRVLAALPARRQNLFFSATFSKEIRELADSFLHEPAEVAVARSNATAELISQVVHPVDKDRKRALLAYLIGRDDWRQVLVFTRTKHGANRLAEQLEKDGISADAIHGNKSQNQRTRALADFKNGKVRVLVATDIAARGLDIEELPHVVNYELPNVPEDYVHRIGRTGRAGSHGQALSLVCAEEQGFMRDIERLMKLQVERVVIEGFEPSRNPPKSTEPAPQRRQQQRPPQKRNGHGNPQQRRNGDGRSGNWNAGQRAGAPQRERSDGGQPRREERGSRPRVAALLGGER